MLHLTLRQLQIFDGVARNLSYSRAARELYLTQPAVSMQMKQLEDNIGLPLFEQLGKKIYLTEAGKELHRHSHGLLTRIGEAKEAMEALKGVDHGRLNIAVVSTAKYFAPRLLAQFCRAHPGVRLNLAVNNREEVLRLLAANEIDLALMGSVPEGMDAIAEPFAQHPLGIIAAPTHPLTRARKIPLKRLQGETLLVREPGSGTRNAMERTFAAHHMQVNYALQMSSNETIKQAVMAGMGISFLSLHTIGLELEAKRLVVLDVAGMPVKRQWNLVHREGKRLSPAASAFREFLLRETAQLIGDPLAVASAAPAPAKVAKPSTKPDVSDVAARRSATKRMVSLPASRGRSIPHPPLGRRK
jgi:LysR family transcriptional regulator, low CO2-responsive transcriptional regulator